MERDTTINTISIRQLGTLLVLALLPLGTEVLPSRLSQAGGAAWLCPLGAGGLLLALVALWGRWITLREDLLKTLEQQKGRKILRGFALVLLAWGLFLTGAQGARIGERLAQSLRASPLLLTAAVLALAGWLVAKGLPAFARTGEIFGLAVGAGFVLIVLFGVFGVAWDRVILWDWAALEEVPGGALSAAGTLAAGGYALLLLGQVRPEEKQKRVLRRKLGVLFGSLAVGMLLVVGRLGAGLTGQIDRPFFQMVSGLGFEGAFQRLEELASALWVLGDVALLGFLLLCMRRLLAALAGREESSGLGWIVTGGSFLLALPLAHGRGIEVLSVVPAGNLVAMGVMSLGLGWKMVFSKKSEKIRIFIDDEGIFALVWNAPHVLEEVEYKAVSLLPFEKIRGIFESMIMVKNKQVEDGTLLRDKNITVTAVRLGLMRIIEKDNNDTAYLVPVWDFFGTYDSDGGTLVIGEDGYESLLTINAVDGSVIDRTLGY